MAGLVIVAVGIVLGVVGGLADQIGIGANDSGDMGGKQIAALVVGVVLVVVGIVLATVLAKDAPASSDSASAGDPGTDATIASATASDTDADAVESGAVDTGD
jgi:hypothetical protein